MEVKLNGLAFDSFSKYWPATAASNANQWCDERLNYGKLYNAHFTFGFGAYEDKIVLSKLEGVSDFEGVSILYIETMPAIENAAGKINFYEDRIEIVIDKGKTYDLEISDGYVNLLKLDQELQYADINLNIDGTVSDALKLIDNEPLKYSQKLGLDYSKITGSAKTNLDMYFPLVSDLLIEDIEIDVKSDLQAVSIPNVYKGKPADNGNLKLEVNSDKMNIKGKVSYQKTVFDVNYEEFFNRDKNDKNVQFDFILDENGKKIFGLDKYKLLNPPYMDGTAKLRGDVRMIDGESGVVGLHSDLTNMEVIFPMIGWVKDKGQAASINSSINFKDDKVTKISGIRLTSGEDLLVKGNVKLVGDNNLDVVEISEIKGNKMDASVIVDFGKNQESMSINVAGNSFNLDNILDKMDEERDKISSEDEENDEDGHFINSDIFIAVDKLWTNDDIYISNVGVNASYKDNEWTKIQAIGNFSEKNIKLDYLPRGNGSYSIFAEADDAGKALQALRLYDNVKGGFLKIDGIYDSDDKMKGLIKIRGLRLTKTPILAKLLNVSSLSGIVDMLKGDGMKFLRMDIPFEYQDKLLKIEDARASGNVVGLTASGELNRNNNKLRFKGMIAPAYGLNSLIGSIPLLGDLLKGKDGTVFGANYTIRGDAGDPEVNVNPFSALSPNSIKELFN